MSDPSPLDKVLTALREMREEDRGAARLSMNRSMVAETRHWCLYASQGLMELREWVLRPNVDWPGIVMTLDESLAMLEALRDYLVSQGKVPPLVHPNELAGAGAPPPGVIIAEQNARRAEQ